MSRKQPLQQTAGCFLELPDFFTPQSSKIDKTFSPKAFYDNTRPDYSK